MPKTKLDKQYLWKGKFYGPGEVEFPTEAIAAFKLAKEQEEQSQELPSVEAEGTASPTTKPPKAKP